METDERPRDWRQIEKALVFAAKEPVGSFVRYLAEEVKRLREMGEEKDRAIRRLATSPVLGECRGCAELGYNVDWRRGDECVKGCFVAAALASLPNEAKP